MDFVDTFMLQPEDSAIAIWGGARIATQLCQKFALYEDFVQDLFFRSHTNLHEEGMDLSKYHQQHIIKNPSK